MTETDSRCDCDCGCCEPAEPFVLPPCGRVLPDGSTIPAPQDDPSAVGHVPVAIDWNPRFAGMSIHDVNKLALELAQEELHRAHGYDGTFALYAMPIIDMVFRYTAVPA